MSDILHKKIQILKLLPKAPARISATEIHSKLSALGFNVHKRTVQRDLNDLAKLFPIENDGNKDIPGWSWNRDAEKLELPEMDTQVALSFQMVKNYISHLMPPSVLQGLSDYFKNADKALSSNNNSLSNWHKKIATLSRSQPLLAPKIDDEILAKVYWALLTDTQLNAIYQPRANEAREYCINPLGLVVIDQVIYLVATLWEYDDVKQFALHRFISAENTDQKITRPDGFSLNDYISAGHFEYLISDTQTNIVLQLRVNPALVKHLSETPLAIDQSFETIEDSTCQVLTATVKNTDQLRWWLLGFGDGVEVLEPKSLREEFKQNALRLNQLYSD